MKYQAMSETVLKAVGGKENITSVTHCATRLRIDARDTSIIDLQLAKSADQALGAVVSGGQLQVIIGPNVTEAYNDFLDFAGIEVGGGTVADDAQTAKDLAEGIKSGNTGTSDDFPDHAPALRRMAPLLAILPNGLPS